MSDKRPAWGLGEAALGWITAQFMGAGLFGIVLAMGYALGRPQRPGGYLGRAIGQVRSGSELVDDSLPLAWQMLLQVPTWIVMLSVTWIMASILGRQRPGWSLKGEAGDIPRGVLAGFLLQIPIVVIVVTILTLIFGDYAPSGRPLALVDGIQNPFDLAALIFVVAIGAPLVEELFYRGVIQRSLVERFGPWIGIGVASVIFGAVHFSWADMAPLTVVGAGFGLLAHKYGRLLPAVIAHMAFNTVTLVVLLTAT